MRIMLMAMALLGCPALSLGANGPATKQDQQQEFNQQLISSATLLLTLGKQAGDVDVVRAFLWADNDPDRKIADSQAHRMIADYALYRAAAEKFGDGASAKMIEQFHLSTPDGIMLSSVSWKIDGDKATPADAVGDFSVTLHNVKGIWKIDVTNDVIAGARAPSAVRQQADAIEAIAKDVAAGEYDDIKHVADALLKAGVK